MRGGNGPLDRREFLLTASGMAVTLAAPSLAAEGEAPMDLPADITELGAAQLSLAIRSRLVSCTEVMQAYLDRIAKLNPVYNAIVSMPEPEDLLAQAAGADRDLERGVYRGWLHGIPHAVKDLADAAGLETSQGSRIFAGTVAPADDLFVSRIRHAGAIFIGKTNAPEFGLGSQTYNDVHGTTFNAYDRRLTAGGSSGGAAVGLATHMLPVADGSDMMGSLRNPGAFNNVVGFRPSQGRVPEYPAVDVFYQRLGVAGPMGRNVEDTIRLLGTMAGFDAHDPLSLRDEMPPFRDFKAAPLSGYRIGWMGDYEGYLPTQPGVLELCEQALQSLSSTTAAVVENCMPRYDMARLWQTWLTCRHWALGGARPLYDNPRQRQLLKPELVWEIEGGFDLTAAQVREAGAARTDWYNALQALFEHYDILALPTAQVFPFDARTHWPETINGRTMDTYHRWMEVVIGGTLAGLPVVNLPAGFNPDGVPMGMQFLGRMGEDKAVLEFALAYEKATSYLDRRPSLPA
jgi:amidase